MRTGTGRRKRSLPHWINEADSVYVALIFVKPVGVITFLISSVTALLVGFFSYNARFWAPNRQSFKIVPPALFVNLHNPIQRSVVLRPFVGSSLVRKTVHRFQIGSTIFNRFCMIPTLSKMSMTQLDSDPTPILRHPANQSFASIRFNGRSY